MSMISKLSLRTLLDIDGPRSLACAGTRKIAWRPAAEMLEPRSLMAAPSLSVSGTNLKEKFEKSFTATVGSFTTSDPSAPASDFHVVINWGDGSTTAGKIKANKHAKGTFTITGTHDYKDGISDQTITITVNESSVASVAIGQPEEATSGQSNSATTDVNVQGAPIKIEDETPVTNEGEPFTGAVASLFADSSKLKNLQITATITYPNGSSETVPFHYVYGFAQASATGVYKFPESMPPSTNSSLAIVVTGSCVINGKQIELLGYTFESVTVNDVPLTAYNPPNQTAVTTAVGNPVIAPVYFLDANSVATANQYTGVITWGDSNRTVLSSSNFRIVGQVNGQTEVEVVSSHTYTAQGIEPVSVTVTDVGGESVQLDTTVTVTGINLQMLGLPNAVLSGTPIDFDDPNPPAMAVFFAGPSQNPANFLGTINWGDGTTSSAFISYQYPSNVFTTGNTMRVDFIQKYIPTGPQTYGHTYAQAGDYTVTLTISNDSGQVLATGTINELINN